MLWCDEKPPLFDASTSAPIAAFKFFVDKDDEALSAKDDDEEELRDLPPDPPPPSLLRRFSTALAIKALDSAAFANARARSVRASIAAFVASAAFLLSALNDVSAFFKSSFTPDASLSNDCTRVCKTRFCSSRESIVVLAISCERDDRSSFSRKFTLSLRMVALASLSEWASLLE